MLFTGEAWHNAQSRARQSLELQYFFEITRWSAISRLSTITTLSSRKKSNPTRITEMLLPKCPLTIPIKINTNWDIIWSILRGQTRTRIAKTLLSIAISLIITKISHYGWSTTTTLSLNAENASYEDQLRNRWELWKAVPMTRMTKRP